MSSLFTPEISPFLRIKTIHLISGVVHVDGKIFYELEAERIACS